MILLRHTLKNTNVRVAVATYFGLSVVLFIVFAALNVSTGNTVSIIIAIFGAAFFALETYAASNWEVG